MQQLTFLKLNLEGNKISNKGFDNLVNYIKNLNKNI